MLDLGFWFISAFHSLAQSVCKINNCSVNELLYLEGYEVPQNSFKQSSGITRFLKEKMCASKIVNYGLRRPRLMSMRLLQNILRCLANKY
jgi:hypothetical protein